MALHKSGEDYLEAVLILGGETPCVRSIDLAAYLGVTKPSVSRAVSILKNDGLLLMEPGGELKLTPAGLEVASSMYERHKLLKAFLIHIGVSPDVAAGDACRMEHVISEESFLKLREYAKQMTEGKTNEL